MDKLNQSLVHWMNEYAQGAYVRITSQNEDSITLECLYYDEYNECYQSFEKVITANE